MEPSLLDDESSPALLQRFARGQETLKVLYRRRPQSKCGGRLSAGGRFARRPLRLDGIVIISRETHANGQQAKLLQGNETKWAGSREMISEPGQGGGFFLTSPPKELIDLVAATAHPAQGYMEGGRKCRQPSIDKFCLD